MARHGGDFAEEQKNTKGTKMRQRKFEVWTDDKCIEPETINASSAVVTDEGRLKFVDGFLGLREVAGFAAGKWQYFKEVKV